MTNANVSMPPLDIQKSKLQKLTHPQLLKGLKEESQVEDSGKKELGHAP